MDSNNNIMIFLIILSFYYYFVVCRLFIALLFWEDKRCVMLSNTFLLDDMSELISVLVVTYNSEGTIIETLDSIINQTYNNIEIIISDDASKDRTIELVKQWRKVNNYNLMKIISAKSNKGVTKNVNRGLKYCSGNLIKIIAGDDTLRKDAIELYYHAYGECGRKKIVLSKVKPFGDVSGQDLAFFERTYKVAMMSPQQQYLYNLKANYVIAPAVGLLNKEMIISNGGFDNRFPAIEDYPFYLKLLKKGYSFCLLDEELVNYRISSKSASRGQSIIYLKSVSEFYFKERFLEQLKNRMFFPMIKQIIYYSSIFIRVLVKLGKYSCCFKVGFI